MPVLSKHRHILASALSVLLIAIAGVSAYHFVATERPGAQRDDAWGQVEKHKLKSFPMELDAFRARNGKYPDEWQILGGGMPESERTRVMLPRSVLFYFSSDDGTHYVFGIEVGERDRVELVTDAAKKTVAVDAATLLQLKAIPSLLTISRQDPHTPEVTKTVLSARELAWSLFQES